MSDLENPYLPPAVIEAPPAFPNLYARDGNKLLVMDRAVLPARCIRTNQPIGPEDKTITKKMAYTPGWIWIFLLFGLLVAAILAIVLQKRFTLTYHLSKAEAARFRNRKLIGIVGLLGGIAAMIGGVANMNGRNFGGAIVVVGLVLMLVGLVFIAISNALSPVGHKNGWFTLKGAKPAFLDSL